MATREKGRIRLLLTQQLIATKPSVQPGTMLCFLLFNLLRKFLF
jgi:hypothetical protein